jgi:hypothetical protein
MNKTWLDFMKKFYFGEWIFVQKEQSIILKIIEKEYSPNYDYYFFWDEVLFQKAKQKLEMGELELISYTRYRPGNWEKDESIPSFCFIDRQKNIYDIMCYRSYKDKYAGELSASIMAYVESVNDWEAVRPINVTFSQKENSKKALELSARILKEIDKDRLEIITSKKEFYLNYY